MVVALTNSLLFGSSSSLIAHGISIFAPLEFSAASEYMDICDLGIPKHLLTTLKMMNLAEENLKWSLRENDARVLLKLVWNKRGRRSGLGSTAVKTQHLAGIWIPVAQEKINYLLLLIKLIKMEAKKCRKE